MPLACESGVSQKPVYQCCSTCQRHVPTIWRSLNWEVAASDVVDVAPAHELLGHFGGMVVEEQAFTRVKWKNRSRLGQCAGADWDTFDAAKLMIFSETVAF